MALHGSNPPFDMKGFPFPTPNRCFKMFQYYADYALKDQHETS